MPHAFAELCNVLYPGRLDAISAAAEFVNASGRWWHDRKAIGCAHAYGRSRLFERALAVAAVRIKPLTAELAVVHARMRLTGQTPVGGVAAPGARSTIFSLVARCGVQRWRCVSAHDTEVVPGAEPHVRDEEGRLPPVSYGRD